jgi:MFS family permease
VFRTYRDVLATPGALAFSSAALLSRLPMSMLGIGIVLLIQATSGSYALAGWVAGVFGLVNAVAAPWVARAVDRFGQARVMLPGIGVHLIGLALLIVTAQADAPAWAIYLAAVIAAGPTGSLGSLVRARWSYVLAGHEREQALLHTAYSLESVLDEVVYIIGPVLVTVLATAVWPPAGLIAAALSVGIGGVLWMLQRRTEPPPSGWRSGGGSGLLRAPGMIVLMLAMAGTGLIFGSMEVLAVAFADEQGAISASGVVLAIWAAGSLVAGLGYGIVHWRMSHGRRFLLAVVVLAVGVGPVMLAQNLVQLGFLIFLAGVAISPMLIAGNGVVQELVEAERLTEGLTWIIAAIGIGMSAGAAIAGSAVDALGARRAFIVPVVSGLTAATIVLLGARWLRSPTPAGGGGRATGTPPGGVSGVSAAPRSPARRAWRG